MNNARGDCEVPQASDAMLCFNSYGSMWPSGESGWIQDQKFWGLIPTASAYLAGGIPCAMSAFIFKGLYYGLLVN